MKGILRVYDLHQDGAVEVRVRADSLESLSAFPDVSSLIVIGLPEDGPVCLDLAPVRNCPRLKTLSVHIDSLDGAEVDLRPLSQVPSLRSVVLQVTSGLMHPDLSPLSMIDGLTLVSVQDSRLADIDLSPLSSCRSLGALTLSGNRLANINLLPLAACVRLRDLNLRGNLLTQIDLSPVSECTQLISLSLAYNLLEVVDLTPLNECKELKALSLYRNPLSSVRRADLAKHVLYAMENGERRDAGREEMDHFFEEWSKDIAERAQSRGEEH